MSDKQSQLPEKYDNRQLQIDKKKTNVIKLYSSPTRTFQRYQKINSENSTIDNIPRIVSTRSNDRNQSPRIKNNDGMGTTGGIGLGGVQYAANNLDVCTPN